MNKLPLPKRIQILSLLCEGNSMRSVSRLADVSINTVTKLLIDAGRACADYQDRALRSLSCQRLQLDEIWAFCYAKQKNVRTAKKAPAMAGDIWTWTALDADSKLIVSWMVGDRSGETANAFVADIAGRLAHRVQITSDGHRPYLEAVERAFGSDVDFAQLVKVYGQPVEAPHRYSPPQCIGAHPYPVNGKPDPDHISTSYVERSNLTIRMSNRRFTRLTNAFSKKAENHCHHIALHFMFYNFCRVHKTLRVTPAIAAGVANKLWEMTDVVKMIDAWEVAQKAA